MNRALAALLLLALAAGRPALAQTRAEATGQPTAGTPPAQVGLAAFFNSPAVVLPRLYAAAVEHSPEIRRLGAGQEIAQADVKLVRKRILSMLAINSSYNYGTLPYFATAETTAPIYQVNPFNLGARAQYSAGMNLTLPLDVLASRRTALSRQDLLVDQAIAQRQVYEQTLRQQVITLYQGLALARTTLLHYQDALQSARLSKQIADRRFQQGELQLDEQLTASEFYNRAMLATDEARNRYQTAELLLENLIGVPVTSISTIPAMKD